MLVKKLCIYFFMFSGLMIDAQSNLYFPQNGSDIWEGQTFEELGWCEEGYEELKMNLEDNQTKAFIVLKDGKIVIEDYFDGFEKDSLWIWFSAGKSLSAFLVGMAQEEGFLNINKSSQEYLGQGWSNLTNTQEEKITVRHHMTMTTGIDYNVEDIYCTDKECLDYLNPPGDHWYYHNPPYSLTRNILEEATGRNLNLYTFQKMHANIGMDGLWIKSGYNNFYLSTARSMARFGLLMLNNGDWNGTTIMQDKSYFNNMVNSSQDLNKSYGYLWWLNGKESYKLPGSDFVFSGPIDPNAASDMYCALGAYSQILCVIPSQNIVMVRMGLAEGEDLVPTTILHDITRGMKEVICETSSTTIINESLSSFEIIPNPSNKRGFKIKSGIQKEIKYAMFDSNKRMIAAGRTKDNELINTQLDPGIYLIVLLDNQRIIGTEKIVVLE